MKGAKFRFPSSKNLVKNDSLQTHTASCLRMDIQLLLHQITTNISFSLSNSIHTTEKIIYAEDFNGQLWSFYIARF